MDQSGVQQEKKDTEGAVNEPQVSQPASSEAQVQDTGDGAALPSLTAAINYITRVDLYILSTGEDQGDSVELYGSINLPSRPMDFRKNFPKNSSWLGDEGYKGKWVAGNEAVGVGVPRGFTVSMYEDDSSRKQWIFKDYTIDFQNPNQKRFGDGSLWTTEGRNQSETRFRGTLAWSVTPGFV